MGAPTHNNESTDVLQGLVYTLLDVFDATRDLYTTLTTKDKREYEIQLRSKGYPTSRKLEFVDDSAANGNRAILTDKLALLRRFEDGLRDCGPEFAVGDALSHVSIQSQVINLQGVLLTTFLYGPTSSESIPQQLSKVDAASRLAATSSVEILSALEYRLQAELRTTDYPTSRRGSLRAFSMPGSFHPDDDNSTALVSYKNPVKVRAGSPANTTILSKNRADMTSDDTRSLVSYGTRTDTDSLYCTYASDLERHRSQQLCSSITHEPTPSCPHCRRTLHLSPGKAWEILKNDTGYERCFQVSNRFVVKCHRSGPDAGYACILCSRAEGDVTICGDVKALVKHICEDHKTAQLKAEEDITEVVELAVGERRRDSGLAHSSSRSSRRSTSAGSRRRGSRPHVYDREVEAIEIRLPRRGA
ncbi:uncharacterized protein EKO05_0004354 [Ascochyta rabiei]|uniref:Uncharacterized protein n=1 Tax=Didymella rabiei TaxID=5454 RepID=A0A162XRF5_DIDRA|nr:uncharacterized protein EKO05_0004354 [Ascochyta rabiei]KZM19657.1 hypothetical protein ST47_g8977 [Ascochyta rabiei]UPX13857.1 hypothetical protein EKO05_0004354 [Ascochyta rabiei]